MGRWTAILAAAALASLWLAACSSGPGYPVLERERIESGDLEGARAALEQRVQRQPNSFDARLTLGEVYYLLARDALDRTKDEKLYLHYLERSVDLLTSAAALVPSNDQPHLYLAAIDAYRGDLLGMIRGLQNCTRLAPYGISYANLAEGFVYKGDLEAARRWNSFARRRGVPPGSVAFNEMLMYWREGNLDRARKRFALLKSQYPSYLSTINMARVPVAPRRFEHFAEYCCGSPACGPYMADACAGLGFEVADRDVSQEAILEELRIEIEAKRRLRKIYEQRKDLHVTVGEEDEEAPPAP